MCKIDGDGTNRILRKKSQCIGHIPRGNCLLHDAMTEVKEVVVRRRRLQLLDDLRNRRIHWELKVEPDDRKR